MFLTAAELKLFRVAVHHGSFALPFDVLPSNSKSSKAVSSPKLATHFWFHTRAAVNAALLIFLIRSGNLYSASDFRHMLGVLAVLLHVVLVVIQVVLIAFWFTA